MSTKVEETLAAGLEKHIDELLNRLLTIIRDGDDGDALKAIDVLLSRVLGRPTERRQLDLTDDRAVSEQMEDWLRTVLDHRADDEAE